MAKPGVEILDAGPTKVSPRWPIMLTMQSTSPIRRYVLLRQPGHAPTASRWSMERVAPAPCAGGSVSEAASPAKAAGVRG